MQKGTFSLLFNLTVSQHAEKITNRCPPASPELAMAGRLRDPLHHIIVRGIERRRIFENNADRDNFLTRLADILKENKTGLLCLPAN